MVFCIHFKLFEILIHFILIMQINITYFKNNLKIFYRFKKTSMLLYQLSFFLDQFLIIQQ
jgi:hypothetical protein